MPYESSTKPVVDAVNDAVSALTDLVRSLRATAKAVKKTGGRGKKGPKVDLGTRLEKAWEVFAHGKDRDGNGRAGGDAQDDGATRARSTGRGGRSTGRRGNRARSTRGDTQE